MIPNTALVTASWIKKRREAMGFSPQELAERVGTSANQIYRYESGDRKPGGPAKAALWYALNEEQHNQTKKTS